MAKPGQSGQQNKHVTQSTKQSKVHNHMNNDWNK